LLAWCAGLFLPTRFDDLDDRRAEISHDKLSFDADGAIPSAVSEPKRGAEGLDDARRDA
jgi:hypothetical protein